jgi:DNA-binding transcriptional ArsR family regulator
MDPDFLFKLTLGVYKVTDLYPETDPLKQKTREKSLKILADLVSASPNPGVRSLFEVKPAIISDIEILESFFSVAEGQDWVDKRNFQVLEREYSRFRQYLAGISQPKQEKQVFSQKQESLSSRQEKILGFLKNGSGAAVREILEYLGGGVSKRTLRRELGELVKAGLAQRIGKCNQIFYQAT